jgi:DNA-binding HxlR family transcriptional regulator
MASKDRLPMTSCPMDYILRQLMGPWTTYIVWVLRNKGPLRFGTLKKEIPGISAKMLTERLRMLERGGLIYREYETTVPPKVTYGLAPRGLELQPVLDSVAELGRAWQREDKVAPKGEDTPPNEAIRQFAK